METWADKPMMRTGSQHGIGADFSLPVRRETLFLDREPQRESQFASHGLSLYGRDPALPTTHSPAIGRTGGPIVTQVSCHICSLSVYFANFVTYT